MSAETAARDQHEELADEALRTPMETFEQFENSFVEKPGGDPNDNMLPHEIKCHFRPVSSPMMCKSYLWTILGVFTCFVIAALYSYSELHFASSIVKTSIAGTCAALQAFVVSQLFAVLGHGKFHCQHLVVIPICFAIAIAMEYVGNPSFAVHVKTTYYTSLPIALFGMRYNSCESKTLAMQLLLKCFFSNIVYLSLLGMTASFMAYAAVYHDQNDGIAASCIDCLASVLLAVLPVAFAQHHIRMLRNIFLKYYYEPRIVWLRNLEQSQNGDITSADPFSGDVESISGAFLAVSSCLLKDLRTIFLLWKVFVAPNSCTWMLTLVSSSAISFSMRTGVWHRTLHRLLTRVRPLCWCTSLTKADSFEVSALRTQFGVGYMSPLILLAFGLLRAISFRNPQAVLFLDVEPMVAVVLIVVLLAEVLEDVCVWIMRKSNRIRFPIAPEWRDHALSDLRYRDITVAGYQFVFVTPWIAGMCYFTTLLGQGFVFGICPDMVQASWHRAVTDDISCS